MIVYLLRHAIAKDRNDWNGKDRDRPLTADGIKKFKKAYLGIAQMKIRWDHVICSPYTRANQTAKMIVDEMNISERIILSETLTPSGNSASLVGLLGNYPIDHTLLLVGHEPSLSSHLFDFIGCQIPRFTLKKGGLARIDFKKKAALNEGMLKWVITQKQLILMA